jgi:hypothetical protein
MKTKQIVWAVVGALAVAPSAVADVWTTPVPVSEVNTQYNEGAPFLTYDGLTLYFSREGPNPQWLYSATRASPSAPFGTAQPLTAINSSADHVNYAWTSPDNLTLYYYEDAWSIYVSHRPSVSTSWPVGSGVPELNALGGVANPSLTPDQLTIVFTGTNVSGGLGGYDIWMGTRADTSKPFGSFRDLKELNSTAVDCHPRLSADGLTLYFMSDRNGTRELFSATRTSLTSLFGAPQELSFFDSLGSWNEYPDISADGQTFYFTRASATTSYDIYVSHVVPSVVPPAPVPVPGAVLLGVLGLTVAGWRLRREPEGSSASK